MNTTMVRFGKQLEIGIYEPWKSYYMQYSRLKRIITRRKFAIDKFWFVLQANGRWYLIMPTSVIQREDYSDIEKKNIN